jgi:hypothetical protein
MEVSMKLLYLRQASTRLWVLLLMLCLLVANLGSAGTAHASPGGCSVIYDGGNGWVIDQCTSDTDPDVAAAPMTVLLNGVSKGNALLIRIYHKSQSDPGTPQVAVIYASGYVRLKQNDDPSPFIPFGTSFILGPAYWAGPSTYYHNPQLTRLEIDTTWLPDSPLRMRALGTNHAFNVTYDMVMPPPRDRQTRLHVDQYYAAAATVNIPAARLANKEGFKLVQASSMFIKNGSPCNGGYTECHDSNDIRFIADDLNRRQLDFSGLTPPSFILSAPRPLGATWLDVLHKDDQSWQSQIGSGMSGNTPNARIALDELPTAYTITPQGWIAPTSDPNDDNVNVWLHDDRPSSGSWTPGKTDKVSYWLLAQDNPPDPWADLGLRQGLTFLNFNGTPNCYLVKDTDTTGTVSPGSGYTDKVLQLSYNLGSANGNWAQIRCDFNPPLNLSAYDHLRFEWRGSRQGGNSLEVGLINPNGKIFGRGYHHVTQHSWWGQVIVPFRHLHAWDPATQFNPAQVSAIFISVVKDPVADVGGAGTIAIDNLGAFNLVARAVPGGFESVDANPRAAQAAANWLASQQHQSGLLRSWEQDPVCWSYTYDQALALIVFARQGMWGRADAIVARLAALQNADGSWHQRHNCDQQVGPGAIQKWEGDIAWTIYALRRYLDLGGTLPGAEPALQKAADWLGTRVSPTTGCLVIDVTEANIDAWWAFQAAGINHANNAERIKNCLLTRYWDNNMGRFKGGQSWWQPYLDNQTWGAAFLKAIGEDQKALRALSFARNVLRLPAQGGQLVGLDGQAGPWSVWNEGISQYAAVGGVGAQNLLWEALAQQRKDGAVPGSPDHFNGGGVWTTRWHGVAPTAWLYNALSGEPFHPSPKNTDVYVGSVKQGAFYVPPSARVNFSGLNSGPVRITNTDGTAMFGAERLLFQAGGAPTSFSELMALPHSLLDTTYWLPWYNNIGGQDTKLRFANVSSSPATVRVYIGGVEMPGSPFTLAVGQTASKGYAASNGPVQIVSTQNIVVAARVIYKVNNIGASFTEMMALPDGQLSRTYWLPWYNNVDLDTQLRIANVSSSPATVRVYIGGMEMPGSPFTLTAGQSTRQSFAGVSAGPVRIVSNQDIVAAERLIYKAAGGVNTSFSETMALPNGQVDTSFWLPWYNNVDLDTQLRIANVGGSTATVRVFIGGQEMPGSPFSLSAGASTRKSFAGVSAGPVRIVGNQNLVVAERVIYKVNGIPTSFTEMMALPNKLLDSTSWLPWYNNTGDLNTQLRFGVP